MDRNDSLSHRRREALLLGLGALLVALGVMVWRQSPLAGDGARSARALLVNFLYFVPLAGGMCAWSAVLELSKAKWAGHLETTLRKGIGFAVPTFAALAALWSAGGPTLYGASAGGGGLWQVPAFIFGRDAAALCIFWAIAWRYFVHRQRGGALIRAGVLVVMYTAVFSLVGFDLSLSLIAPWKSTVFGLYFAASGLYCAIAAFTLCAAFDPRARTGQLHDLGKLLVAMSLICAYLMGAQLLTIWYGNLPEETRFITDRTATARWRIVDIILIVTVYLGPLALLLPASFKRHRGYLGFVAALVLCGMWLERLWLVAPGFCAGPVIGIREAAVTGAFAGALIIGFTATHPAAAADTGAAAAASALPEGPLS
jgi:hypothetical protein